MFGLIAPVLAAGNTIVYKPSEVTLLTPTKLFEILKETLPSLPSILSGWLRVLIA